MQRFEATYRGNITGAIKLLEVYGESLENVMFAELDREARMKVASSEFTLISVKFA